MSEKEIKSNIRKLREKHIFGLCVALEESFINYSNKHLSDIVTKAEIILGFQLTLNRILRNDKK